MKHLLIAGNWKSNKTIEEVKEWVKKFIVHSSSFIEKSDSATVVICAPFTTLSTLKEQIQELQLPISVAAQNVSRFDEGAYTGEISARQIREVADWVIIGHSERRKFQGETDDDLAAKAEKAKNTGLRVIYCVPDEHTSVPAGVDVVAYEPVWAIGTGKTDTPENANSVCGKIKERVGRGAQVWIRRNMLSSF
ncbi:MAG: Triosephosphate isomerase [Microgenomates group bacterium GW2011_GWA2_47_8]|nr:MAG: Triosephosphate isomerase [Microgenomates group bacterium GW2011_GWA2_47_8]